MRIAMIGSRGLPARAGGVEHVVAELASELAALGHEVLVYSRRHYAGAKAGTDDPDSQPRRPAGSPGSVRPIFSPGLAGKHLDTITHSLTAALDVLRRDVDVVHVHSPGPAVWSWLPAMASRPVVFTVHAPDWRRRRWSPPARAALRAGLACGMRTAAAVTSVSSELASELAERFGRRVEHIPNAVRPRAAPLAASLRRWNLRPDGYVLYVGRIVPEKRLDWLLDAWSEHADWPPLVVVGDWRETPYGRRCRARASEAGDVRFIGPQYGDALARLYSHAGIVAQPSGLEGQSLVLLEAASYGRCIVAGDLPQNRETLGQSAVYFDLEDRTGLARQIGRCIQQPAVRDRAGREARNRLAALPGWPEVASRYAHLFRQVRERVCRY